MKNISLNKIVDFVKKKYMFVLVGLGVVLLLVSFIPEKKETVKTNNTYTSDQYITETENKLKKILVQMLGTNDISVMITLNNSVEYVYADSTKISTDIKENTDATVGKTEQKDSKENEYIIIKDESGKEQALLVTQMMPQIRGVLVVCPNGNNTVIKETVKNAVVTVLDISSKKVCVTGNFN